MDSIFAIEQGSKNWIFIIDKNMKCKKGFDPQPKKLIANKCSIFCLSLE